ncbi:MAG: arylsulfatase A-like enzyme [Planctomycetota bacterium]|jgi:arylsulfatase A-like enzyme
MTKWLAVVFVLLLCRQGLWAQTNKPQAEPPPNVLFLFADDQRPDAFGAAGNPHIHTPNIDALAARGFRFSRNYCLGSIHGAVCIPSRAMVMSGRTLYRVAMDLSGVPTIPKTLARRGYRTFGTGKWHNGRSAFLNNFQEGQAVMLGGMSNHIKVPVQDKISKKEFGERRIGKKPSSELFADAAINFLRSVDTKKKKPFFCYVAFTAPHDPRQPTDKSRAIYDQKRPPLPANFMPVHPFHNGWMDGRDETLAAWPRTKSVIADQLAEYYGLVTDMDRQIGRILATLKAQGLAKNTIVVYAADHGLAMGSHGLLGKQSVYEHSMGCPLVLAGPGIPKGQSSAFSYLFDLFPTLCDLTKTKKPGGLEGKSLKPVMDGVTDRVRNSIFLAYENLMRSVRNERYKLIRYPLIDHLQLFDLKNDPHEMHDLGQDPKHTTRIEDLTKMMKAWQEKIGDPHPLKIAKPRSKVLDIKKLKRKPDRHQPQWIIDKYFKK